MAVKKEMKCSSCGYKVDVYEGKGLFGQHIVQMTCPDCHTVQNLVVGGVIGDVAPSFNTEVGRLCLRCGSSRISKWNGHTCPKCGGEMEETGSREFWT